MADRAWVTGASGFLGRHVCRALSASGFRVLGIGRGEFGDGEAAAWGIERWRSTPIEAARLVDLAASDGAPALVCHCAGSGSVGFSLAHPLDDFRANVETTAHVIEALRRAAPAARLVLASSAAVYGAAPAGPLREERDPAPISPYGEHKYLAERLCLAASRQFGLRCAAIRYFSLYGRGLGKQLLWDVALKLARAQGSITLHGTGDEVRDFMHVEDAATLMVRVGLAPDDSPIVVNGGSGVGSTVREVVSPLVASLRPDVSVRFNRAGRAGDPLHLQADLRRARALGHASRWSLAAGIEDYAAWVRTVHPCVFPRR